MIIQPRVRGFVCVTAHPAGCARNVQEQIERVQSRGRIEGGARKVLVIGSSTGYGLSSRVAAAFGCGAGTVGVFFERPSLKGKPASPGWYNSAAFEAAAREAGIPSASINGDAFSAGAKERTLEVVREVLGPVDLVIYSLASPRRTHPVTEEVFKSTLKPVGEPFSSKTLNTDKGTVEPVTIDPASPEEIAATEAVMGGEDWELWIEALEAAGLLAPGATSLAYSYIGPRETWPVYKDGTIGKAKEHLERSAQKIDARLKVGRGRAFVSVNKAVVTQASSAIPVVPLYISILFKIMRAKGTHEGCIEQAYRLFADQLYGSGGLDFDDRGRVRLDDLEMDPEVQEAVSAIWPKVTSETLGDLADFADYQREFLRLFGFGLEGVDYGADVDPVVEIPGLVELPAT